MTPQASNDAPQLRGRSMRLSWPLPFACRGPLPSSLLPLVPFPRLSPRALAAGSQAPLWVLPATPAGAVLANPPPPLLGLWVVIQPRSCLLGKALQGPRSFRFDCLAEQRFSLPQSQCPAPATDVINDVSQRPPDRLL